MKPLCIGLSNKYGSVKRNCTIRMQSSQLRTEAEGLAQPRKLLVEYDAPIKLPAMAETPPFNWMEFFPRSFTLSVISTVLVLVSRLISAASSAFKRLEITQLIQPQDAQLPQAVVEDLAFVDQQLAADHLIARGGVAGEIDAPHEELLAFVDRQRQVDLSAFGCGSKDGSATKSMKPKSPYSLRMFSMPLRSLAVENTSPFRHPEQRRHQSFGRAEKFHAGERDVVQVI